VLFLPSFGAGVVIPAQVFAEGPYGLGWLRPQALFGIEGLDPLVHAVFWSRCCSTAAAFVAVSLLSFPGPLERLQGAQFVNVFEHSPGPQGWVAGPCRGRGSAGHGAAHPRPGRGAGAVPGRGGGAGQAGLSARHHAGIPRALERELSGSVGGATAHAMIGQITGARRCRSKT
jgi:hypothetical protein